MRHATAAQLPYWRNPQGSLALVIAQSTCTLFFALWDDVGEEHLEELGKITFTKCWATNSLATKFLPYIIDPHDFNSYLPEIANSTWLATAGQQRAHTYLAWRSWDKTAYHHYLVQGADSYAAVLAAHFTADLATPEECQQYAFLRN